MVEVGAGSFMNRIVHLNEYKKGTSNLTDSRQDASIHLESFRTWHWTLAANRIRSKGIKKNWNRMATNLKL